ncbi:hypothetical protein FGB62_22g827 [Gracilaria domingensis]|nr:hypothetical protein FGB62_22g827 [Gracilaria domingensis]
MVARNDSNNTVHKPGAFRRHDTSNLAILKRPLCEGLSRRQRLQRASKSHLQQKLRIPNSKSNVQHLPESEERTQQNSYSSCDMPTSYPFDSVTNRVVPSPHTHTGESSSGSYIVIQPPSNTVEMLVSLMAHAAVNHISCESVLRCTREHLLFDLILSDLDPKSRRRLRLGQGRLPPHILSATRNALDGVGRQGSDEMYATLTNISDPVCQFVCCSMFFVDCERDPFFKALDLDKVINVLSPQSFPFFARIFSFIRPPVQSLTMSPICEQFLPIIVDSLIGMLGATARSIRRLTVYLPDDQMVEVLQNAKFALEALEELCIWVRGERIREYNQPEASNAIHGLFERVSFMCPQLKRISLRDAGVGRAPAVKVRRLPSSVDHVVSVRDIDLLNCFDFCGGLKTITIHVAHIDFEKFVLFECEGGFPQLERVNLVNCVFEPSNPTFAHVSPRLRNCIRTIANDPLDVIPYFPVEGLNWFLGDLPSLEVLELYLNTEADAYICETLGYVVDDLPCLKSFTVQVLETTLRHENLENFKRLFQSLLRSGCDLEHLRMPNIWVSTDMLYPFLERKGGSLKTLDVKVHHGSCRDEETDRVLRWVDVVEVLRHLSRWCPKISNVCIGEKELLQRVMMGKEKLEDSGIRHEEYGEVKRVWEEAVLAFDRVKASCEVYRSAMRIGDGKRLSGAGEIGMRSVFKL